MTDEHRYIDTWKLNKFPLLYFVHASVAVYEFILSTFTETRIKLKAHLQLFWVHAALQDPDILPCEGLPQHVVVKMNALEDRDSQVLYWLTGTLIQVLKNHGILMYRALMAKVREPTDNSHRRLPPGLQKLVNFIRPEELVYQQISSQSSLAT